MLRRSLFTFSAAALIAAAIPFSAPAHAAGAVKHLKIGVTAGLHSEILHAALPVAKKNGLDIQVIEFQDYVSPNEALSHGDLDANIQQTLSYLQLQNKQRHYGLAAVGKTITAPLTFYSKKWKKLEDLPNGAKIGIPNDASTEGRALYLLQSAGLIKLKASAGREGSPLDITSNPKKFKFVELDPAQTARSLDDLDAADILGRDRIQRLHRGPHEDAEGDPGREARAPVHQLHRGAREGQGRGLGEDAREVLPGSVGPRFHQQGLQGKHHREFLTPA